MQCFKGWSNGLAQVAPEDGVASTSLSRHAASCIAYVVADVFCIGNLPAVYTGLKIIGECSICHRSEVHIKPCVLHCAGRE